MKCQSFRALRGKVGGGGGLNSDKNTNTINESSSFSDNLMIREKLRASRGGGEYEFRQGLRVIV